MKKETYKEKTRGVEHSSEDIENTRMKENSGLHGQYVFAGSREKENFYTVDNVFCLIHSNFHLNLIVLSPLTVVNFLLHTTHSTHRNRPAELAVNTTAHSSAHTNLASPPLTQHWKFYNTSKDFSKVHFAVSVSLHFWNSMIPLNTPSFLKHFLKYHTFSQPLLPAIEE